MIAVRTQPRMVQAWLEGVYGGIPDDLGVSNTQQRHWRKRCGRTHTWYGSPKSLRDNLSSNGGTALDGCYACEGKGSALEARMYEAAAGLDWIGAPQAKVLGNGYSDADLLVCWPHPICVMADGEQHICKDMHGKSVAEQQATDHAFNMEALARGYHVIRLHYADCVASELAAAASAINLAAQQGHRVLFFSTSFYGVQYGKL